MQLRWVGEHVQREEIAQEFKSVLEAKVGVQPSSRWATSTLSNFVFPAGYPAGNSLIKRHCYRYRLVTNINEHLIYQRLEAVVRVHSRESVYHF